MVQYQKKEVILTAQNISKYYGDKLILRDIDFQVKDIVRPDCLQGQVVSLIGTSGVGKCITGDTKIIVRNKITKEVKEITIIEFKNLFPILADPKKYKPTDFKKN